MSNLHTSTHNEQSEDFLFELRQVMSRKYLIKVKIIFSKDFVLNTIALFAADLNYIKEEIVPKRFHQRTNERLTITNNSRLNVVSKVDDAISNKIFEIKTSFLLVQGIHHVVILGSPFFNLVTPYTINYHGITFKAQDTKLIFPFIEKLKTRYLNTIKAYSIYNSEINDLIQGKQTQLLHLKQDLSSNRIEKQLQDSHIKEKILNY